MRTLMISATLLFTVMTCVAFGVVAGYAALVGILNSFGRRPRQAPPALAPIEVKASSH